MSTKTVEQKIREIYKSSDEFKAALETQFGKEFFNQDVIERIDGWEDMLSETGYPDTPKFMELPEKLRDHFQKYYRMVVMTEAYNEGEKMDIYDSDKPRHYPVFLTKGSPSAFAFNNSNYDNSNANAGSRSHLSKKNLKRQRPNPLVKNNNSNGVSRM